MRLAPHFFVIRSRIELATRCNRQSKSIDKQFRRVRLVEPSSRIYDRFACEWVYFASVEFTNSFRDGRKLLEWYAGKFPGHLRCIDLKKWKSDFFSSAN